MSLGGRDMTPRSQVLPASLGAAGLGRSLWAPAVQGKPFTLGSLKLSPQPVWTSWHPRTQVLVSMTTKHLYHMHVSG